MATKQKILILGGTQFVGRQLVEQLSTEKDTDIYLFNRGKTNSDLFPHVKRIIGDRETDDIEKISQFKWDYIVDFSSYFPKSLQRTLHYINKDVKKYIYISTISVFSFPDYDGTFKLTEDFKRKEYREEQLTDTTDQTYGERKAACEDILNATTWLNSIILRPAVIYGQYDPTDRLYYWIDRVKNRKRIILPENGKFLISLTYATDLLKIILSSLQGKLANGTYNCVSEEPFQIKAMLDEIKQQTQSTCEFKSVPLKQLVANKWTAAEFPFCWGINLMVDNTKLNNALGIQTTSLQASLQATIEYYKNQDWQQLKVGLSYEVEDEFLEEINES